MAGLEALTAEVAELRGRLERAEAALAIQNLKARYAQLATDLAMAQVPGSHEVPVTPSPHH